MCSLISLLAAVALGAIAAHASGAALVPAGTIPLPRVEGRIDHLAIDRDGQRLFVAALGNDTVEVIDLRSQRRIRQITGFHEPQGLAWVPSHDRLVVANGETGEVDFVDGHSFEVVTRVKLGSDADNLRFDAAADRLFVGYGAGAIAVLDAATGTRLGETPLGGHPESFQLAGKDRLVANVPDRHALMIIDRLRSTVVKRIPITNAAANYPMALDEAGRRVFIGCRRPAVVLVLDLDSGAQLESAPIDGDTDDLFYDAGTRQLFAICGGGSISIISQEAADRYAGSRVPTAAGARTGLFSAELRRLFVAVPHRGGQAAAISVYQIP
jgi:hypothetical protein